jgi:short-subunit dehydrogenase
VRTEFHDAMIEHGFDRAQIPDQLWMTADAVVTASLAALGNGQVLFVPGEDNLDIARTSLQRQLEDL